VNTFASSSPIAGSLYSRASAVMVGGVTAAGRFNPALGRPHYFGRGDGPRLWDVDGHEFLDFSSSNGASMLGHNHPRIKAAVRDALDMGTMCTQETTLHVALCERLTQVIPSAERVRLANTGTEATMAAIRIARAATGRDKVLKFEGHFHGMHDYVMFNSHTPVRPYEHMVPAYPDSAGIPSAIGDLLVNVPFNDEEALLHALDLHGDDIACVILEPISYNLGCVPAEPGWLGLLRRETERRRIVLVFDEVLSGFRMALGGAQEYYGVTPDLTTLAKALGAGWPIAAVVGSASVMEVLGPVGTVVMSGTYTGHLASVAAALAALDVMEEPGFYPTLNAVASRLYLGFDRLFKESGVPGHVQGIGARFGLYFGIETPVRDYATARRFDVEKNNAFLSACPEQGLHFHDFGTKMAPMHYGITAAHTEFDIDEALRRLEHVFAGLAVGEYKPGAPGGRVHGEPVARALGSSGARPAGYLTTPGTSTSEGASTE
jgi:glutamate-1-semialdehyde 2,1-aminomutase